MTTSKTIASNGTPIRYEDRGSGPPVIFIHDWASSADFWEPQIGFLASHEFRAVARDRCGHVSPVGYDMDTCADDLAQFIEVLDFEDAVLVGHGSGGGEAVRYVRRYGTSLVAKIVLVSAVPPLMIETDVNPHGTPMEVFDEMRAGILADRSRFFRDFAEKFYGANRPGGVVPQSVLDAFSSRAMAWDLESQLEGIAAFSETDFAEDLKKIDVPTMIIHGDDDQIVPIVASALRSSRLVKNSVLKVYEGAPHGLTFTHADRFNADLRAFIQQRGRT